MYNIHIADGLSAFIERDRNVNFKFIFQNGETSNDKT